MSYASDDEVNVALSRSPLKSIVVETYNSGSADDLPKSTHVEQFYVLDETMNTTPTPTPLPPIYDSLYTTDSQVINPVDNNDKQHSNCYLEGIKHLTTPPEQRPQPITNDEILISYATSETEITPKPSTITLPSGDMYADTTQAITSYDRSEPSYQPVNLYTTDSAQVTPEKPPLNLYLPKTPPERKLPTLSKAKSHIWEDDQFEANPGRMSKKKNNKLAEGMVRNWNSEVVDFFEEMRNGCQNLDKAHWKYFSSVTHQFTDTAVLYAKIIISELGLKYEEKTIKPTEIGGIAGGQKYLFHNILFKFALDVLISDDPVFWMYGGTSGPNHKLAMKSAKNEMKGLQVVSAAHIKDIYVPLMTVIDYKGYRVIAMAVLPISKSTLKYGSDNSGQTVVNNDKELAKKMQELGKASNLKGHVTGQGAAKQFVYGPGDIEGHKGKDGRYYLLDFGRVMPPEDPRVRGDPGKRSVFYNLLRPELVKNYPVPLCSDAFTAWNSDDNEANRLRNNLEVTQATEYLYNEVIPSYAQELDEIAKTFDWKSFWECQKKSQIREKMYHILSKSELHKRGINMRQLGFIREKVTSADMKKLILCICIADVIKDNLKDRMRNTMYEFGVPSDDPFKNDVVKLFNITLGHCKVARTFWSEEIPNEIAYKYVKCLSEAEQDPKFNLRESISLRVVFSQLLHKTAIKLRRKAVKQLLLDPSCFKFVESDVKSLDAKVMTGSLMHFADGMRMYLQAGDTSVTWADDERNRILLASIESFNKSHSENTTCSVVLHRWAQAQATLAQSSKQNRLDRYEESFLLFDKSKRYYPSYRPGMVDYADALRDALSYCAEEKQHSHYEKYKERLGEVESSIMALEAAAH